MDNRLHTRGHAQRAWRVTAAVLSALAGALALSALSLLAAPSAATFYVDPAGNNANPCTAPGVAACKTIAGALGKSAVGDSILVAAGTYGEHLTIDKSVTINGAGASSTIVDGGKTQRVLTVTFGSIVVLSNLAVTRGSTAGNGGGILNDGALTLNNVTVMTNTAANGGGIYNGGTLLLSNSLVLTNAAGSGGGIYNFGPLLSLASTTLSATVVSANVAITDGGGIYSSHNASVLPGSARLTLQSVRVDSNTAGHSGAGIYNNGTLLGNAGLIQLNRSNDGTGLGGGGGIYIESGQAAFTSTSLYANSTNSGYGGGIYNYSGTLALKNAPITLGAAARGGGLSTGPGGRTSVTGSDFGNDTAFYGGAIENRGALTLTGVTIHQSRGDNAGGGIYSSGFLTVSGGSILNSEAWGAGYGGGGVYLSGGAGSIDGMSIIGNSANLTYTESGGGIYASGALLTLTNSHVDGNFWGYLGQGGGIAAYSTTIVLSNVTLDNNAGGGAGLGGGLYLQNVTATLSNLTVSGNTQTYAGGGIDSESSRVTLSNGSINGNIASSNGGGIQTYLGTLNLTNVTLDGNQAGSDGGGLDLYDTPASLNYVTLSNNHGTRDGGGINHYKNTLSLNNVTLSGNVSDSGVSQGYGGGVYNDSGALIVMSSTLSYNAARQGGGLFNARDSASDLTNVTLSANSAITGGGAFNQSGIGNPTIITLTNGTLKDNSATDGGGVYNATDANDFVFLKNTILADSPAGGNCKGKAFTAANYSLSTDGTCTLTGIGNLTITPAQLNPLANNGGPTRTHLPQPASPAVNGVGGSDCPSFDQRGIGRPQGASCDIGAVERQLSDPALSPLLDLPVIMR